MCNLHHLYVCEGYHLLCNTNINLSYENKTLVIFISFRFQFNYSFKTFSAINSSRM